MSSKKSKALPTPSAAKKEPNRNLSPKESTLFKELLTLYETKQLKKGIKTADSILKKYPEHGETICMKGLVLVHMGRRDEGIELVRKGIKLDLTSHIVWHVYGLIQKGEKKYEDALRSYMQALRFDKENLNLLRDVSSLQTHLRLYDALIDTRQTLLRLRPTVRQHWVGLAVAYHLAAGTYNLSSSVGASVSGSAIADTKSRIQYLTSASRVLEGYTGTLKNVPQYDVEHGEVLAWRVKILEEIGDAELHLQMPEESENEDNGEGKGKGKWKEALALLDICAKERTIVDRTGIMEMRARLLSKLHPPSAGSEKGEAEHAWRVLIEHNPDCVDYYLAYMRNLGVDIDSKLKTKTKESRARALVILHEFSIQFPKANVPRRLALSLASVSSTLEGSGNVEGVETDFTPLVRTYILSGLKKGVPSLFVDLKSLYDHDGPEGEGKEKMKVVQEIVEGFREEFAPKEGTSLKGDPTTYLWTLYFLAQHYAHPLASAPNAPSYGLTSSKANAQAGLQASISLLQTALSHTPTLPELYTLYARVLKRSGDYKGAALKMKDARELDGQDRYINTKAGKYLLRAGQVEEAEKVLGLFTKKDAPSPSADLEDMQSLSYLLEEGDAHLRAATAYSPGSMSKNNNNQTSGDGKGLAMALKKYMSVVRIFSDYFEDQYDFHGYSLRKFMINIYLGMLSWEDTLLSHPAYVRAVLGAVRIYVDVYDDPTLALGGGGDGNTTEAEKKAKKKAAKKEKAQKEKELKEKEKEATSSSPTTSTNEDKGLEIPYKDDDPDGSKLLMSAVGVSVGEGAGAGSQTPTQSGPQGQVGSIGLERAFKLLQPLTMLPSPQCEGNVEVWIAFYDVTARRGKHLQAMQALARAKALDPENPELHVRMIHFKHRYTSAPPSTLPSPADAVFTSTLDALFPPDVSIETYNSQYLQKYSSSSRGVLAYAQAAHIIGASLGEVEDALSGILREGVVVDVKTAVSASSYLKKLGSSRVEEIHKAFDEDVFPLSTCFNTTSTTEVSDGYGVEEKDIGEKETETDLGDGTTEGTTATT